MTGVRQLLKRIRAAAGVAVLAAAMVGAMASATPRGACAAEFFASIEDLPLPDGFVELEGDGMVFESPAGRIVTAVARGSASPETVRAFYRGALPPLGWERRGVDRYQRDDEQLSFAFEPSGKALILRVRLVPGNEE